MLLTCCILSGCDYIDSIKGIGFKKAQKLVEDSGEENTVSINLILIILVSRGNDLPKG
jgi:5'-3' exonuclease